MAILPDVIVTNFKRRVTGVSTTALRLTQAQSGDAAFTLNLCGPTHDLRLWQVLLRGWQRPTGRPFRIWHVRRDSEMLWGLIAKHILRQPIALVFTSSQKEAHSRLPAWMIRRIDALIVTSPATAAARMAQGKVPNLVQGHGVDTQVFRPLKTRPDPSTGVHFAQVGRVRDEKGSKLFIDAICQTFPAHPSARAHIFGQSKDAAYVAALKSALQTAGVAQQVIWHGEVPAEAMPAKLATCHCLVAVPRREAYGLTPFEGMAAALDLICTDTGAFAAATDDGRTGALIPIDDLAMLCQAMTERLENPTAMIERGQHNHKRAGAEFSIQQEAGQVNSLYFALWGKTLREV